MTTEQAATKLMDLLHTDILSLDSTAEPWERLEEATERWSALSSGEQAVVSFARAVWSGAASQGSVALLGSLDKQTRLGVLAVVADYYGAM